MELGAELAGGRQMDRIEGAKRDGQHDASRVEDTIVDSDEIDAREGLPSARDGALAGWHERS